MCEQAAEAHKAKGAIHSSRRSRMSSDASQISRDSTVDAILTGSNSGLPAKVQPLVVFLIIYCVLSAHNWFFVYSCSSYMVIYFRIQVLLLHGSHHLRIVMVMIITIIRSKEWQKLWTWLETEIHGKMMSMILYLMPLSWCLRIVQVRPMVHQSWAWIGHPFSLNTLMCNLFRFWISDLVSLLVVFLLNEEYLSK